LYTLHFLGGAWVEGPEGALPGRVAQPRRLALLALLASAGGQPISRDKLIALLWPESSPENARHSLADSVYVLSRELGVSPVVAVGNGLRLDPAVVSSDLAGFEEAVGSGNLERAVGLYKGPFLEGLYIREALEFEEWLDQERARLERALCQALERLAREAMAGGRPKEAARWLHRLVEHEPYGGRVVARLMEALAASGDLAGALQQAASHAVRMRQELDADPDPAVVEMEQTLRARRTEEAPPVSATARVESSLPPRRPIERAFPIVFGRARLLGIVGIGIVLLGLIIASLREQSGMGTSRAAAVGTPPGIAVMPFQVADPSLAAWEEAIVDLMATNLDGVGSLRAISSRTVLAQWRESVTEEQVPDLPTVLEIARDAGGSYAVVGNAVTIGRNIRLSAEVYDLRTGHAIGSVRADGPPDSLYPLVDRLSLEVLRAILEEDAEELRAVPDLASITTTSLPALRHYLEGEALLRMAEFEKAEVKFRRAVEADSSFALAWFGRVRAAEWMPSYADPVELVSQLDRALAVPDRLSPRERGKAEVFRAIFLASWFRARELAQELVQSYPDDPTAWYLLHWTYARGPVPGDPAGLEIASRRAIQLDPTFAPFRRDLLYEAFYAARREDTAEQLEAYAQLAPEDHQLLEGGRLAYRLAWGDSVARAQAWRAVDTLDAGILNVAGTYLLHARFLPLSEALYRESLSRLDRTEQCAVCLTAVLVWQGKIEEAIRSLDHPLLGPSSRGHIGYALHSLRVATLPDTLERELAFQVADTNDWLFEGAYAADRGRWSEHAAAVRALRAAGRGMGRDSIDARAFGGTADALEGYGLWKRGRAREALPLLIAGQRNMVGYAYPYEEPPRRVCWWIGLLFLELGRPAEAIQYLHQAPAPSWNPYAAYDLARAYAGAGMNREAIDRYRYALTAWRDADPVLHPRIETARREIARLGRAVD
jgi:DNA-binding SARP family transcriptional activator/TolB-like protein